MLKAIVIVTLLVRNLAGVTPAYEEHFDYREAERGVVSEELTHVWDAPAMAGQPYIILKPASGAPVYLRFIEAPPGTPPTPVLRTQGWNAAELLVEDPDRLARRLEDSPFRMIGPPADLMPQKDAPRAMQLIGPAGELLYLTRIIPGGSGFDLGGAVTPVDRVFIAVVGGPSIGALRDFYATKLGMPLSETLHWQIDILARAHGLPLSTTFPLAVAMMPRDFLVELDEYPAGTPNRRRASGSLPGGIAMVAFLVDDIDSLGQDGSGVRWRARPRRLDAFPYDGREAAVTVGPAGEWLEMIQSNEPP